MRRVVDAGSNSVQGAASSAGSSLLVSPFVLVAGEASYVDAGVVHNIVV